MSIKLVDTVQLPAYALPYIFDADSSGLADNDIVEIDDFVNQYDSPTFNILGVPDFCTLPAFGLACDCYATEVYEPITKEPK